MVFNPYKVLQVDCRANSDVIKAAYHVLLKKKHPDKAITSASASEEAMKLLNMAYDILSDSKKRKEYDNERKVKLGNLIGNYRVLESIAEGGFGETYKGEHLITADPVCIKHCSSVSVEHDEILIRETKAVWDLRHYALPVMRDLQKLDDGSMALIMSYIPGPTLEQVVDKIGSVDPETVAWVAERILNALLYLHHHGVIHGDIKPQNIIIQPKQHSVVMVDFGLAMVKPGSSEKSKGYTPIFAPPEQIKGKVLLPASDYYSLGKVMVYALNAGKRMDKNEVPATVPDDMVDFIAEITKENILERPQKNLFDHFVKVRHRSFGRARSGMKQIPGFDE